MNRTQLQAMASRGDKVRLFPNPVQIVWPSGGGTPEVSVYDNAFTLVALPGDDVGLLTDGQRTIGGLTASEIHNFVAPNWLVMRKLLVFKIRWTGDNDLGIAVANPWTCTVEWKVVPPVVCPACGAKIR